LMLSCILLRCLQMWYNNFQPPAFPPFFFHQLNYCLNQYLKFSSHFCLRSEENFSLLYYYIRYNSAKEVRLCLTHFLSIKPCLQFSEGSLVKNWKKYLQLLSKTEKRNSGPLKNCKTREGSHNYTLILYY
jgi:hypothetical protein